MLSIKEPTHLQPYLVKCFAHVRYLKMESAPVLPEATPTHGTAVGFATGTGTSPGGGTLPAPSTMAPQVNAVVSIDNEMFHLQKYVSLFAHYYGGGRGADFAILFLLWIEN